MSLHSYILLCIHEGRRLFILLSMYSICILLIFEITNDEITFLQFLNILTCLDRNTNHLCKNNKNKYILLMCIQYTHNTHKCTHCCSVTK